MTRHKEVRIPRSKLIDTHQTDSFDGRPVITDGDGLLFALWKYHAGMMPEGNLPPLEFTKYDYHRINGEQI